VRESSRDVAAARGLVKASIEAKQKHISIWKYRLRSQPEELSPITQVGEASAQINQSAALLAGQLGAIVGANYVQTLQTAMNTWQEDESAENLRALRGRVEALLPVFTEQMPTSCRELVIGERDTMLKHLDTLADNLGIEFELPED
jgi:hypothetical protein